LFAAFGGNPDELPQRIGFWDSDFVHDQTADFYEQLAAEAEDELIPFAPDGEDEDELTADDPDAAAVAAETTGATDSSTSTLFNFFGSLTPQPVLERDMLPAVLANFCFDESERQGVDVAAMALSTMSRILVPESGQPSWCAEVLPPDM
jgi:hypothetical protein